MCLRARSCTGCLTSDWWAVFTGAGGLPRTSSPFAAALHLLNSWAGAEPDGQTGTQTSLSVSAPSEGFFGLSSTAWMSGCLFVLLLGLKKKKKNLLYSYSKNSFQDKQHLIFLWNLRAYMYFHLHSSVKPHSQPERCVTFSSLFYR